MTHPEKYFDPGSRPERVRHARPLGSAALSIEQRRNCYWDGHAGVDLWEDFDKKFLEELPLRRNPSAFLDKSSQLDPTSQYLMSIAHLPLLNKEGEVELSQRIEAGLYATDKLLELEATETTHPDHQDLMLLEQEAAKAKQMMIEANLKLVVWKARKYMGRGESMVLLDLVQEGNVGLVHAVEKFDYTKGIKFSTYSMYWIRKSINNALESRSTTIQLPQRKYQEVTKLLDTQQKLEQELGREVSPEDLAQELKVSVQQVVETINIHHMQPQRFETPVGEVGSTFGDFIRDDTKPQVEDVITHVSLSKELNRILGSQGEDGVNLTPQEKEALELSFGLYDSEPRSYTEIGKTIGISRVDAVRVVKEALAKLSQDKRVLQGLEVYRR